VKRPSQNVCLNLIIFLKACIVDSFQLYEPFITNCHSLHACLTETTDCGGRVGYVSGVERKMEMEEVISIPRECWRLVEQSHASLPGTIGQHGGH